MTTVDIPRLFDEFGDRESSSSSWVHHAIPVFAQGEWPKFPDEYIIARSSLLAKRPTADGPAQFFSIELHASVHAPRCFRVVSHEFRGGRAALGNTTIRGDQREARTCASMNEALAVFGSLFRERESPLHRFVPVIATSSPAGSVVGATDLAPSSLPEPIRDIVRTLYLEAAAQLGATSRSIVGISSAQVDKAVSILHRIKSKLDGGSLDESSASTLSREFFSSVPSLTSSSAGLIDSAESLESWFETTQLLKDVLAMGEASVAFDHAGDLRDVDLLYRSLSCDVSQLDPDSVEAEAVSQLVAESGLPPGMRLGRVFGVRRSMDANSFAVGMPNQRLLFHGTKPSNLLGILSRGLMLPDAVVSKFGVARTNAGLLGCGIYFAARAAVSMQYTAASAQGSRFMLVCTVALGRTFDTSAVLPSTTRSPPQGFDSVRGVGRAESPKSAFADDEFVVYSPSQQRMQYLLEFLTDQQSKASPGQGAIGRLGLDRQIRPDQSTGRDASAGKPPPLPTPTDPKTRKYGLQTTGGVEIPLEDVSVHVKMLDMVGDVTIFQCYSNRSEGPLEAKYVFPLDEMSAVTGFEAWINDKHVIGVCKEKEQAHREYKEAVERGDGAYLLDEAKDNAFTITIGNIPAKTKVVIKVNYVQELAVEGEARKFVYPATLVPHQAADALSTHLQNVTQSVAVGSAGRFELEVGISMPSWIQQIASPSHTILCKKTSTKATVRWIEEAPPKIDFVLLVRIADVRAPCMWLEESDIAGDETRAAMVVLYPDLPQKEDLSTEYIIICDLSNSMAACEFDTKNVTLGLIHGIPALAPFNVFAFGSSFESLFLSSKPRNDTAFKAAIGFAGQMKANWGASVLWPVLKYLFLTIECRGADAAAVDTNIFLISDGDWASAAECRQLVADHCKRPGNRTRLFTIAMGATPHRHNASSISRVGCGAVEYVGPSSPLSKQDEKQLSRAAQPSLGAISVEWDGEDTPRQAPGAVQALFSGERTIIYALVQPGCTSVKISAQDSSGSGNYGAIASSSPATATKGLLVHRLCTRAIVRDWEDGRLGDSVIASELEKEKRKQEIIDLGVTYSLATPLTSFIAVEERSEAEKKGLTILPPTPPLSMIDKIRVDEIPFCGSWEKVEKAMALQTGQRIKIGEGRPNVHLTIYDFWQMPPDDVSKKGRKGKKGKERGRRLHRAEEESESESDGDGDFEPAPAPKEVTIARKRNGGGGGHATDVIVSSKKAEKKRKKKIKHEFEAEMMMMKDTRLGSYNPTPLPDVDEPRFQEMTKSDEQGDQLLDALAAPAVGSASAVSAAVASAAPAAPPPPPPVRRGEKEKKREDEKKEDSQEITRGLRDTGAREEAGKQGRETKNAESDGKDSLLANIRSATKLRKVNAVDKSAPAFEPAPKPAKHRPAPPAAAAAAAPRAVASPRPPKPEPPTTTTSSSSAAPMSPPATRAPPPKRPVPAGRGGAPPPRSPAGHAASSFVPTPAPDLPPPPPPPPMDQPMTGGFPGSSFGRFDRGSEYFGAASSDDYDRLRPLSFPAQSDAYDGVMALKSAARYQKRAKCFIATAAYGTPLDPRIDSLRWFRDHVLSRSAPGRAFIVSYYTLSPPIAKWLEVRPIARFVVRVLLWPLVFAIDNPHALIVVLIAAIICILGLTH